MPRHLSFREDALYLTIEKASRRQLAAREKAHREWIYGKEPWTLARLRSSKKKFLAADRMYTSTIRRLLRRRDVLIRKWALR